MIKRLIELIRAYSSGETEANMIPSDMPGSEVGREHVPADQVTSEVVADADFRIYYGGCC